MLYIEHFTHANKLRQYHPLERFIFGFSSMLICLTFDSITVHILALTMMLLLLINKAQIPHKVVTRLMAVPLSFLFLGVLAIMVSIGFTETPMLASIKISNVVIGITENNLALGLRTLTKSLGCIACLYFIALTIPLMELIYVLKMFRLPALVLELMMLIYRFIFVFIDISINIYTAQSSRWGHSGFKRSLHSYGLLFANLWAKGFFRSQALFTSLLSRGYADELKVLYPTYRYSARNIAVYAALTLSLLMAGVTL